MKKYNIVVSPDFKIMLDEILNMYLQCSPLYVRKILKDIIHKRFSILYRIDNNEVDILYFIDNRMQNDNYLSEEIEVYQV